MRILWLSHNVPYPPAGGVLQRNYHLIREAAGRAEVHLVALRQHALCPDPEALARAHRELSALCASVRIFEIDWEVSSVRRLRSILALLMTRTPYDVLRFASSGLARAFGAGKFPPVDLVHVDTIGLVPYRRFLLDVPAVLNHHNIESQLLARRAHNEPNPIRRALFSRQARRLRAWEHRYAPSFDSNLAVSELDRQRLTAIAPGTRTTLVPNGVDTSYFAGPANAEAHNLSIVFVGSHSWHPNRDAAIYFLEAIWPLVTQQEPRARWTLIGRNPDPRIQRAALGDRRIHVLGFLEDLRPQLTEAAVFICPFREGGGTRLKVLDALAMRKALVSTSVGVEGVPLTDGRHFLRADTPASFARCVLALFRRPELRAALGEAGRGVVEARFAWSRIGSVLHRAYEEAIADHAAGRAPPSPRHSPD